MQDTKMEIKLNAKFRKQYRRANLKIRKAFLQRLELFQQNSQNPLLRDHQLTGKYKNYRSINITGDYRALYIEKEGFIEFQLLGTHSQLYG